MEWHRALTVAFGVHPHHYTLPVPLGRWIDDKISWSWYYSPSEERVYFQTNEQWQFHPRLPGRASRAATMRFTRLAHRVTAPNLPDDLERATVQWTPAYLTCTGSACTLTSPSPTPAPTFNDYLATLDPDVAWAVRNLATAVDGTGIAGAIASGRYIGISDESFKDAFGTAAWILIDK